MPNKKLIYNSYNKAFARGHRTEGTKGEAILWKNVLRARQMEGYQFNRQLRIGNYIVDFACRRLKLIIEIDGSSHLMKAEQDRVRQSELEKEGFVVIRFSEAEVLFRIDEVVSGIYYAIKSREEALGK